MHVECKPYDVYELYKPIKSDSLFLSNISKSNLYLVEFVMSWISSISLLDFLRIELILSINYFLRNMYIPSRNLMTSGDKILSFFIQNNNMLVIFWAITAHNVRCTNPNQFDKKGDKYYGIFIPLFFQHSITQIGTESYTRSKVTGE